VGMERTPKRPAVIGFASTSSFATRTFVLCSFAISSRIGATIRQGPHQVAQKSTRTGVSDFRTSVSNDWSLTTVGFVTFTSSRLSPSERELVPILFHRRFEAKHGLEPLQTRLAVGQVGPERPPLREAPPPASNELG